MYLGKVQVVRFVQQWQGKTPFTRKKPCAGPDSDLVASWVEEDKQSVWGLLKT